MGYSLMQIFSYLSKIASSGSILAWDGTKIAASKGILHNPEKDETTIGGSLSVGNIVKASGGFQGSLTKLTDGSPYVVAGDNITVTTSSAGSLHISAETSSPVIWKWNEKDTSQFNISCDTIGTGSIGVVNSSWGKILRVDFKQKTTSGVFIININDIGIPLDNQNRFRYLLRFRLCNFSGIAREWNGIGASFLSNDEADEDYYGLGNVCFFGNQNVKAIKVEAGQVKYGSNNPPGPKVPLISQYGRPITNFEFEVCSLLTRKSIGFQNSWTVRNSSNTNAGSSGVDDTYYTSEFGPFRGEWAQQDLGSCGIVIFAGEGTSQAHFDIDNIEVIKHPMDW